jgi:hypothetical protein
LTLAALLALLIALPAQAHSTGDGPVIAATPPAIEVIVGTVEELVIEDRVKNTTRSYYGLQRDDGTTVLLTGPGAEALHGVAGKHQLRLPFSVAARTRLPSPAPTPTTRRRS